MAISETLERFFGNIQQLCAQNLILSVICVVGTSSTHHIGIMMIKANSSYYTLSVSSKSLAVISLSRIKEA